jgi:hypothetical protein
MKQAECERWAEDFTGCSDHSCIVRRPTGMGTNGGCRCRPSILHVVMRRMKRHIEHLEYETSHRTLGKSSHGEHYECLLYPAIS